MIIDKNEYYEMGFECAPENEKLLESCLIRAEYVLNAISGGTVNSAIKQSASSEALIKQAAAFETEALLKAELSDNLHSVSAGDFSYTTAEKDTVDVQQTVKRLLSAAGCFRGTGIVEVIE